MSGDKSKHEDSGNLDESFNRSDGTATTNRLAQKDMSHLGENLDEFVGSLSCSTPSKKEPGWLQGLMTLPLIPGLQFNAGMGLHLLLLDLLVGLPFSYAVTTLNKIFFTHLGYEKIFRLPSGILGQRILFVALNVILVLSWASQLESEERDKNRERSERFKREIEIWDQCIERLENERSRIDGILDGEAKKQLRDEIQGVTLTGDGHETNESDADEPTRMPPVLGNRIQRKDKGVSLMANGRPTISRHQGALLARSLLTDPIIVDDLQEVRFMDGLERQETGQGKSIRVKAASEDNEVPLTTGVRARTAPKDLSSEDDLVVEKRVQPKTQRKKTIRLRRKMVVESDDDDDI